MSEPNPERDSLVLYRQGAARVHEVGSKRLTIELVDGERLLVRPKDVVVLHPGPIRDLSVLDARPVPAGDARRQPADLIIAWELLAGGETNLRELAELAFGDYTPVAAWAVWRAVADGLYFAGVPDRIKVLPAEHVRQEEERREARRREQREWDEFVQRLTAGKTVSSDAADRLPVGRYLQDVEALALGKQPQSLVLRALGSEQTLQNAHELLLRTGYWSESVNPYPARAGVETGSADGAVPGLAAEPRRDLAHLPALAIDDEGNEDPDDALSWENGRIWVHIADVAAIARPDSALDLAARSRGSNLYLPEATVTMLPPELTRLLGLGLEEVSPALSFGLDVAPDGRIENVEIVPSWVRVTRLTYEAAQQRINEPLLRDLRALASAYRLRRLRQGAIEIDLPEVRVRVHDGEVSVRPLPSLQSRDLVREAMLMTGEAVALFAQENGIAIPFTTQEAPSAVLPQGDGMATMFATRRLLKPSQQSAVPGSHSGLGMAHYAQATSPLRRYLDLVVHQQLRAYLQDQPLLSPREITERIGAVALIQRDLRSVENLSKRHWTLVYLMRHPGWEGEGVIVEQHGRRYLLLLPTLDLEAELYLPGERPPAAGGRPLDSSVRLKLTEVNLPFLSAKFAPLTSQQNP